MAEDDHVRPGKVVQVCRAKDIEHCSTDSGRCAVLNVLCVLCAALFAQVVPRRGHSAHSDMGKGERNNHW